MLCGWDGRCVVPVVHRWRSVPDIALVLLIIYAYCRGGCGVVGNTKRFGRRVVKSKPFMACMSKPKQRMKAQQTVVMSMRAPHIIADTRLALVRVAASAVATSARFPSGTGGTNGASSCRFADSDVPRCLTQQAVPTPRVSEQQRRPLEGVQCRAVRINGAALRQARVTTSRSSNHRSWIEAGGASQRAERLRWSTA